MSVIETTQQVAGSGAPEMHRVTLRIGLFFDGTGNNRINTHIAARCRAQVVINNAHIRECAGRHTQPASSYSNDLSNVARLYELYSRQSKVRATKNGGRACWPIYISGIGTTSGKCDSVWAGQSFGRGSTGVIAKVARGVKKLGAVLDAFKAENPGCVIEGLELDLFGFSRGAAAARHFANEVLKQAKGALGPLLDQKQIPWSPDFAWHNASVKLKVIGLFDTVAAMGSLKDWGNVRDAANRGINLYLPPGSAQQVLHLVAGDELRRNFALNSIAPDWPREVVVPGAHSDVGGGYHPQVWEKLFLTRPRRSIVSLDTNCHASAAWLESELDLQAIDASQWLDPLDVGASLCVECCENYPGAGSNKVGIKAVLAAVSLERRVFGHLSRVYLRVMHALACAEGVPLGPIPDTPELRLVPELQVVAQKLIAYAKGGPDTLDESERRMLRQRYIHRSAHWNAAVGSGGSLSDAVFVHAPQPGGRVHHPHVSQPGYPR